MGLVVMDLILDRAFGTIILLYNCLLVAMCVLECNLCSIIS